MSELPNYYAFGFAFSSEIELPGVAPAPSTHAPCVAVRLGRVPARLPEAAARGVAYEVAEGQFLLAIDNIARFYVRDGREITVEPCANAKLSDVRLFLMGSAFGALLHQRGLVPLHASAVRVGDGCVAFTGVTGAGKSTLAGFMRRRGYEVLCDDVCPFEISAEKIPLVWPGFPRIKLWAESLDSLGISKSDVSQVRSELEKYELPVDLNGATQPIPLRRVYVLGEANSSEQEGIQRATGMDRLETLLTNTYRFHFIEGLGQKRPHFQSCAAALSSITISRLTRRRNLARMDETIDWLEKDFETLSTSGL